MSSNKRGRGFRRSRVAFFFFTPSSRLAQFIPQRRAAGAQVYFLFPELQKSRGREKATDKLMSCRKQMPGVIIPRSLCQNGLSSGDISHYTVLTPLFETSHYTKKNKNRNQLTTMETNCSAEFKNAFFSIKISNSFFENMKNSLVG